MKKILIILIILSILIAGCGGGRTPLIPPIYTGTEGITIEYLKNIPPQKVYEGQSFVIVVNLNNKGAYSLNKTTLNEQGFVYLDYDPLYFNGVIKTAGFYLKGKSNDYPKGEGILLDIAELNVNEILGTRVAPKTKITASVCYPYQTILSKEICIDQDYMKVLKNPVCTNPGTYTFSSQGAPVAITKIEADMLPLGNSVTQPVFRITLRNLGKGLVITKKDGMTLTNLCSPIRADSSPDNFNILKVSAWLGSEENQLKCEPQDVTLWNNEVEITCTSDPLQSVNNPAMQNAVGNNNYMSLLTVKAEYIYRDFVTKEIEIARVYR